MEWSGSARDLRAKSKFFAAGYRRTTSISWVVAPRQLAPVKLVQLLRGQSFADVAARISAPAEAVPGAADVRGGRYFCAMMGGPMRRRCCNTSRVRDETKMPTASRPPRTASCLSRL
jgi:hypothetical protein